MSPRLARHAAMKRCPRKEATAASGYMRFRERCQRWPEGDCRVLFSAMTVQYTATADANPALVVSCACRSPAPRGAVGNADDGMQALIPPTLVNGLPSGVADTLTGGFDTEELETWARPRH
ncbi:baseplate J/gp47 family protein [Salmonella enterica subsp. enterica]|nr:baseplate J/gp47 family protein [Salmonella enterica subsp. enterica]